MQGLVRVALTMLALVVVSPLAAQTSNFSILVNSDGSAATGCTVTASGQTFAGADSRLYITTTVGATPVVQDVRLQPCVSGSFAGPGSDVGGPHPVGLNNGVAGSDVVEASAPVVALITPGSTFIRLGVLAESTTGSDVLFTTDGSVGGPPFGIAIPFLIPTLTAGGLVLLGALLLLLAVRFGRHALTARVLGVSLIVGSGVVLAANFVVDGQVGDWQGVPQLANDPAGDASNGSAALDLRAFFAAREGDNVYFRIDVGDLENQPPVMNPAAATTNEDNAVTVTLSGTDPEGQTITFAIASQPTNGTLSNLTQVPPNQATVLYTPNPDYFGPDSFTFTGNDGQATSAPGTATITVNPVNDAPSFTASNPPAVGEDAGTQTIPNWATFDPGPPNESAQTVLAYTVSNVSNGALFSTPPAVATNGTLTYTPAVNANGSSTFDVVVQDDGGTANGGVDTSPPQTFTITVNAINDAPVMTAGGTLGYTENNAPAGVDPAVTVSDVDSANLVGATVQITAGFQSGADQLACSACGGIGAVFAGDTLTLSGSATVAAYQTALLGVTYENTSENPTTTPRTITWIANDGAAANNLSAPVISTINVTAINDPPVNAVPGPQQTADTVPLAFSTANGNALSTTDPDAGTGDILLNLSVAPSGTLTLGSTAGLVTVVGNGTGTVSATGQITAVNNALQGLTYTPVPGTSAAITLTFTIDDQGNSPAPAQVDTDAVTINVDAPPAVTAVTPPDAATNQASNTDLTVTFSESVTLGAGWLQVACTVSGTRTDADGAVTGGPAAYTFNPTADFAPGESCTATIFAAQVTDNDAIDPPNNMAANFVWAFSIDAAPSVTNFTPANGALDQPTSANLTATFSEPVNVGASWFQIVCTISGTRNVTDTVITGGPTTFTIDPNTDFTPAETCTTTIFAVQVTDQDGNDPPDSMLADFTSSFSTDAAPSVTTLVPNAGATNVAVNTNLTATFSEPVNVGATWFQIVCTLSGTRNVSDTVVTGGPTTFTINPNADFTPAETCTTTIDAAQVADQDGNDPPDNMLANFVASFDTDAAPAVQAVTPANGVINHAPNGDLTVTFTEPVNVAGNWFQIVCTVSGTRNVADTVVSGGPTTFTINPNTDFIAGESCAPTIFAAQVADQDAGDPPDNMAADFAWTFATDAPPAVQAVTPPNGATDQPNDTDLTVTFTEPVSVGATWFQIVCTISGTRNVADTAVTGGPSTFTINPNVDFAAAGESCTTTIAAAQVTDVDAADPPDNMAADFVWTFTTDAAPAVTTTVPTNGATDVAGNATITVNFSESVNATTASFSIECPIGLAQTYTLSASPAASFTLTPTSSLPGGVTCTVTAVAAQISDADADDPPNNMAANFVFSFTTDAAPAVTTTVPANGTTQVATNTAITVNFSESVNATTASFTIECPVPGNLQTYTLSTSPSATFTLTPSALLPLGTTCTVTVLAAQITDADLNDPPDNMAADFVFSFTTDGPPAVTSTVPVNGATGVAPGADITINFNELVNATTASFTIECPTGSGALAYALSASPSASFTLNPVADLPAGNVCTVTVIATQINDADAGDPPDNMLANFVFSFTVPAIANDDSYNVSPHLTLDANSGTQGEVDANDILGAGVITGFGPVGTCAAQLPNGVNFVTTGGGGRVVLNADGSFVYLPPADARFGSPNDAFCYTVTDGDTAQVSFVFQNQPVIWFVDTSYGGANGASNGTQGRPYTQLAGAGSFDAGASDDPNDTIFVADGNYTCGLTLLAGQRLIGDGSSSSLGAILAFAPVSGSTLPVFSGTDPVLSSGSLTDCVALEATATTKTVRGVTIANSGGAGGDSADINGTGFGTLALLETTLSGSGTALDLDNGTIAAGALDDLDVTAATAQGVRLNQVAGSLTVAAATTIAGTTGVGMDVQNSAAVLTFAGTTVTKASAGPGVNLNNNTGTITFNALGVSTTNGAALTADSCTSVVVTTNTGTLSATGGPALNSTGTGWNAQFTSTTSSGSPTQGINLNNITGTLTLGGGSIGTATGTSFFGQGTLGTTTYAGSITKANAGKIVVISGAAGGSVTLSGNLACNTGCTGIDVLNRNAGTITFSGVSKALNTTASNGVTLTGNAGATINFTNGGLDIDTTTGIGFSATGPGPAATTGGTVTVQGAVNTIDSVSATALNLLNTTIGAADLTFERVSSGNATAAADPANGIVLNNTGSSGGLTVTGTGATASGGVIQNTTGTGIVLSSTRDIVLDRLDITTTGLHGVSGTGVTNFSMSNAAVSGTGNADGESAFFFGTLAAQNVSGTFTLNAVSVSNFFEFGVSIINNAGQLTLNVTNSSFDNNDDTLGESAILVQPQGTAGAVVNVTGTTFNNVEGNALRYNAEGTGTNDANIISNTVSNQGGPDNFPTSPAFNIASFDQNTVTFDIQSNNLQNVVGDGVVVLGDGNVQGRIGGGTPALGNTINGDPGIGDGVRFDMDGVFGAVVNSANFTWTVLAQQNTITIGSVATPTGDDGVQILNRDHVGTMNLTIANNGLSHTNSEGVRYFSGERGTPVLGDTNALVAIDTNPHTNTSVGFGELDMVLRSTDQAIACFNITGNTRATAPFEIDFQEADTSTVSITQASLAALGAANGGATVSESDPAVAFGVACSPPLPTNP
jgi:methionine-rich copper-binding protein CopC